MVLKGFKKWILSQGAVEVRLGVVEQNKAAIRFWEKMGFSLLEICPPKIFGIKEQKVLVYKSKII
jgi:ribosomal protein S18 acetylase RimI-like enzyme